MSSEVQMAEMSKILFTNLQLLGMDVEEMEQKYKIPFNEEMFTLPNKAGSEAVLYFLFHRLNPTLTGEQFRDCWPVFDKKTELQFRKMCNSWLTVIQKNEEEDSHLPRINASLLLSPGGRKFLHLLSSFSTFVLTQVMKQENGVTGHEGLLRPLPLNTDTLSQLPEEALYSGQEICTSKLFEQLHLIIAGNRKWKDYSLELVKTYRGLLKSIRDLEQEKRLQVNITADSAIKHGCTLPARRSLSLFDSSRDAYAMKRNKRIEKMRYNWKLVNNFSKKTKERREMIRSMIDTNQAKVKLDGSELGVRVPGLLLRQCKKEIQELEIDNVYIGGKLNLVSVIQLYNLCLKLYQEQLKTDTLPDFTPEIPLITKQAHRHHAHHLTIEQMKSDMELAIPELQKSISRLQKFLESQDGSGVAGNTNQNNLGLGLSTHTPGNPPRVEGPWDKTPEIDEKTKAGLSSQVLASQAASHDTPEFVSMVSKDIDNTFQNGLESQDEHSHSLNFLHRLQPQTQRKAQNDGSLGNVRNQGLESKLEKPRGKPPPVRKVAASKEAQPIQRGTIDKKVIKTKPTQHKEKLEPEATPKRNPQQKALDDLADSIVNEMMQGEDLSEEADAASPSSEVLEYELEETAFKSRDLLPRSPMANTPTPASKATSGSSSKQGIKKPTKDITSELRDLNQSLSRSLKFSPATDARELLDKRQTPELASSLQSPFYSKPTTNANGSQFSPFNKQHESPYVSPKQKKPESALNFSSDQSRLLSLSGHHSPSREVDDIPDAVYSSPTDSSFLYLHPTDSSQQLPSHTRGNGVKLTPPSAHQEFAEQSSLNKSANSSQSSFLREVENVSHREILEDENVLSSSHQGYIGRSPLNTSRLAHQSVSEERENVSLSGKFSPRVDYLISPERDFLSSSVRSKKPSSNSPRKEQDLVSPEYESPGLFMERPPGDGEASSESPVQPPGRIVFGVDDENDDDDLLDLNKMSSLSLLSPESLTHSSAEPPSDRLEQSGRLDFPDSPPIYDSGSDRKTTQLDFLYDMDNLSDIHIPELVTDDNDLPFAEDNLDDSFVPFKQGIMLDGGSPSKANRSSQLSFNSSSPTQGYKTSSGLQRGSSGKPKSNPISAAAGSPHLSPAFGKESPLSTQAPDATQARLAFLQQKVSQLINDSDKEDDHSTPRQASSKDFADIDELLSL